ncbi:hypothetical protein [Empedobacter brevis]|uniref:hypothetical protein n=2 Tax=Empedobacter brevis TaxID=247 RepID=UPI002FE0DC3A
MIPYLIPFERVGKFILNDSIENYIHLFSFTIEDHSNKEAPSVNYSIDQPEMTLFVNNKIIESIACYEELLYKGKNLIGMTIADFINHIGENYYGEIDELNFEDDNIPQFVYEFESVDLQVWVKGDQGKIVTIIVSSY